MSCFSALNFSSRNCTTLRRSSDSSLGRGFGPEIWRAKGISVPGLYLTMKSYPCILSNILWSLGPAGQLKDSSSESSQEVCDLIDSAKQVRAKFLTSNNNNSKASRAQYLHIVSRCLLVL